jgi:hypothetical protein
MKNKTITKFAETITFNYSETKALWICYQNHNFQSCCEFNFIQIEAMIGICLNKNQLDCLMKMLASPC